VEFEAKTREGEWPSIGAPREISVSVPQNSSNRATVRVNVQPMSGESGGLFHLFFFVCRWWQLDTKLSGIAQGGEYGHETAM
jgi:hypothetical protein